MTQGFCSSTLIQLFMIRFSRSEDYAVILVNYLSQFYQKRTVPLSEVSKLYNISPLFLRNLANTLKKAGIIDAVEGKHGGYTLVKSPGELKMGEVLSVFSHKPMLECCSHGKTEKGCDKEAICPTGRVWRKLNQNFLKQVSDLTLTEFMAYETKN